jgi:putative Holliday junction resolvase
VKRIAALDFGEVRIGLAVSDERQKIALPRTTLSAKRNLEETAAIVAKELQGLGPLDAVILGLPLFMNGKESPMSQKVRQFAAILRKASASSKRLKLS